jgi:hypothetical protein
MAIKSFLPSTARRLLWRDRSATIHPSIHHRYCSRAGAQTTRMKSWNISLVPFSFRSEKDMNMSPVNPPLLLRPFM